MTKGGIKSFFFFNHPSTFACSVQCAVQSATVQYSHNMIQCMIQRNIRSNMSI